MSDKELIERLKDLQNKSGVYSVTVSEAAKDDPEYEFIAAITNEGLPLIERLAAEVESLKTENNKLRESVAYLRGFDVGGLGE